MMGNLDITCNAYADGNLIGELCMSKGGVDWRPANKRTRTYSWEKFAELLERGKVPAPRRRRARKSSRKTPKRRKVASTGARRRSTRSARSRSFDTSR
jgi:hypothetical protein